jgi:hypothetical protein
VARYKVRLDDGSEIVLELQAVKDWYTQGLLTRDSPVLKPGSSQWLPLVRALQLVDPGSSRALPKTSPPPAPRRSGDGGGAGAALRMALVLLVAAGVVAGGLYAWSLRGDAAAVEAPTVTAAPQLTLDQLREQSVANVTREVPLFGAATAEKLVRSSEAQALSPEEAFRRGFGAAVRGVSKLKPAEARELSSLTSSVYARVSAGERSKIGAYLEKLKSGRPTTAQEDRDAAAVWKRGLTGFPAAKLARLQELYAGAIDAGLR